MKGDILKARLFQNIQFSLVNVSEKHKIMSSYSLK